MLAAPQALSSQGDTDSCNLGACREMHARLCEFSWRLMCRQQGSMGCVPSQNCSTLEMRPTMSNFSSSTLSWSPSQVHQTYLPWPCMTHGATLCFTNTLLCFALLACPLASLRVHCRYSMSCCVCPVKRTGTPCHASHMSSAGCAAVAARSLLCLAGLHVHGGSCGLAAGTHMWLCLIRRCAGQFVPRFKA